MLNDKVKAVVNSVINQPGVKEVNEAVDLLAQKLTDLFVKDTVDMCMKDYKNQGNYGAGYRIANEVKKMFSSDEEVNLS